MTVVTNLALAALAALGVRPAAVLVAGFLETLETLFMQGVALIETGYQKVPALIMVLSALLVLPAVALVSFMVQRKARRRASAAAVRAAQRRAEEDAGDWTKDTLSGTTIPAWTSQAWLTIEGRRAGTVPLAGQSVFTNSSGEPLMPLVEGMVLNSMGVPADCASDRSAPYVDAWGDALGRGALKRTP